MSDETTWLDAGCISAAPTGCVSDSECAAARRCLLRQAPVKPPPSPHDIGLEAARRALVGTFGPHLSKQMAERVIAAYLSALTAAGLVVVPREPTEAMRRAAFGPVLHGGKGGPISADYIRQEAALTVYRVMIAAAPTQEGS